jgi:RNA polymerase sigma-70 factor (ECF subfamily)
MHLSDERIEALLERAAHRSDSAILDLLDGHRQRLGRVVAARLDRRLLPRLDPSDVVQDVLFEALHRMPDYLEHRPLPFYPWLRRLAWDRIVKLYHQHVTAQRRSVTRELNLSLMVSDDSVCELARHVVQRQASPSGQMVHAELRDRVRTALQEIPESDRELLVMKYLEELTLREIASIAGISIPAVKARHLRALKRLCERLGAQETTE